MSNELRYTLTLKDLFTGKMNEAIGGTSKLDGAMSKLNERVSGFGATIAGAFSVYAIASTAKEIVMTTAKMEALNNVINYTSKDANDAATNHAFLNDIISRMKLPMVETTEGFSKLSGAMLGSNLAGQGTRDIFEGVSTAAAAFHLTAEDTNGVFLALSQMMSKGTVSAEELRGQLGERLPGAFGIAADAMGVTQQELGKMMQKGEVLSEEFLPKFAAELKKQFEGAIPQSVNSLQANMNAFSNSWIKLQEQIGNSQEGLVNGTIKWATNLISSFSNVMTAMDKITLAFKNTGLEYSGMQKLLFHTGGDLFGETAIGADIKLQNKLQEMFLSQPQKNKGAALNDKSLLMDMLKGLYQDKNQDKTSDAFKRKVAIYQGAIGELDKVIGSFSDNVATVGGGSVANKDGAGKGGSKSPSTSALGTGVSVTAARPQNLTINIAKLIETMNLRAADLRDSAIQIKEEVAKALLEAVNDVNTVTK